MNEELFMKRVFELAEKGLGSVSLNPLVGCVIECNDTIIGEGYHQKYGEAHAEVNAINSVGDKNLISQSTLYVNLEPCSHFGKTPPCADLIISKGIPRVIVCNVDPNPLVAGAGIQKLKVAGIDVKVGLLEEAGKYINRRFFTNINQKRPYVILKWAQTHDGFMARTNYDSKWISNAMSRRLVHKWRSEEDAVMVGFNTAKYDNPQLNVRDWTGRNPVRIIDDKNLDLPKTHHTFDGKQKTIVLNSLKEGVENSINYIKINLDNVQQILNKLMQNGIGSVMVEGGAKFIHKFIEEGIWDEARVFVSEKVFGEGIIAPKLNRQPVLKEDSMGDDLYWYKF